MVEEEAIDDDPHPGIQKAERYESVVNRLVAQALERTKRIHYRRGVCVRESERESDNSSIHLSIHHRTFLQQNATNTPFPVETTPRLTYRIFSPPVVSLSSSNNYLFFFWFGGI